MSDIFERACNYFSCLRKREKLRNFNTKEERTIYNKYNDNLSVDENGINNNIIPDFEKRVLRSSIKKSIQLENKELEKYPTNQSQTKKISRKMWTLNEDITLELYHSQYPGNFNEISIKIPGKSSLQCKKRFKKLKLSKKRKNWSTKEDNLLLELISKYGLNWQLIANNIPNRTGKQVRDRFINKLNPNINHSPWNEEEDKILIKFYYQIGPKWSEISKKLNGRPENMVKNRFYSFIKKKLSNEEFVQSVSSETYVNNKFFDESFSEEEEDLYSVETKKNLDSNDKKNDSDNFKEGKLIEEEEKNNYNKISFENLKKNGYNSNFLNFSDLDEEENLEVRSFEFYPKNAKIFKEKSLNSLYPNEHFEKNSMDIEKNYFIQINNHSSRSASDESKYNLQNKNNESSFGKILVNNFPSNKTNYTNYEDYFNIENQLE